MQAKDIVATLQQEFPGKEIKLLPNKRWPTEIICVVEPTEPHPRWSMAIVIIDKSRAHKHEHVRELYIVEHGALQLYVDGTCYILSEGDWMEVNAGKVHWARGDRTRVRIYSSPGWRKEDHILVPENN